MVDGHDVRLSRTISGDERAETAEEKRRRETDGEREPDAVRDLWHRPGGW